MVSWLKDNNHILKYIGKFSLFILLFFTVDFCISFFLADGLKKYYGLNTPSEILMVGHSHTMLGLDKYKIEESIHCKVAKYAIEGANVQDRFTMIKHFLHQNGDSVKIIIYDVDAFFITGEGLSKNSYKLFFPFMDDLYIDEYLRMETKSCYEYLIKKWIRTSRFTDLNLNGSLRGHLGFYSNLKYGVIDTLEYKKRIDKNDFRKITFDKQLQEKFEEILKLVSGKNIKLVLLLIPTIDILNRTEPEKYDKAIGLLREYSQKYKNVYFLNYNYELAKEHDLFYDAVHLNQKGNREVTARLINELKEISLE